MKFNTSKRGFILVLIALCLTVAGVPVLADETAGYNADSYTGLFALNPMVAPGTPVQVTMVTMKPDEVPALFTMRSPLKISEYTGNTAAFRPGYVSGSKKVSPLFDTLLESFRANPRATLSPPGGNAPIYCRGG
jgi:hypothetical protein